MSIFLMLMQASSMAAAANAVALEEMDWKIKLSGQELDHVNKWLDEAQGKLCKKMCIC
jgi:hypothetical protein